MTEAERVLTEIADLAAEMFAKLQLEPGDVWTDFASRQAEPQAWLQYDRLIKRLEAATSGVTAIPPA